MQYCHCRGCIKVRSNFDDAMEKLESSDPDDAMYGPHFFLKWKVSRVSQFQTTDNICYYRFCFLII